MSGFMTGLGECVGQTIVDQRCWCHGLRQTQNLNQHQRNMTQQKHHRQNQNQSRNQSQSRNWLDPNRQHPRQDQHNLQHHPQRDPQNQSIYQYHSAYGEYQRNNLGHLSPAKHTSPHPGLVPPGYPAHHANGLGVKHERHIHHFQPQQPSYAPPNACFPPAPPDGRFFAGPLNHGFMPHPPPNPPPQYPVPPNQAFPLSNPEEQASPLNAEKPSYVPSLFHSHISIPPLYGQPKVFASNGSTNGKATGMMSAKVPMSKVQNPSKNSWSRNSKKGLQTLMQQLMGKNDLRQRCSSGFTARLPFRINGDRTRSQTYCNEGGLADESQLSVSRDMESQRL